MSFFSPTPTVLCPYRPCQVRHATGVVDLPPLPLAFWPAASVPALPGFTAYVVPDDTWHEGLPIEGLAPTLHAVGGTLLIPDRARAWLPYAGQAAHPYGSALEGFARRPQRAWHAAGQRLSLDRPVIMGIVNTTPDSFSDGGAYVSLPSALAQARQLAAHGADVIDIGGESTRPGAAEVELAEEIDRVIPLLVSLSQGSPLGCLISVDTRKSELARRALEAGANIINDISALSDPAMAEVVAEAGAGLVLMHMRGTPATMQSDLHYDDLFAEIVDFLEDRLRLAFGAGIDLRSVVIDPGIGFGKGLADNLTLLVAANKLAALGRAVLLGPSRKRFLGEISGRPVEERGAATVVAVSIAIFAQADILRVHDVAAAVDANALYLHLKDRLCFTALHPH